MIRAFAISYLLLASLVMTWYALTHHPLAPGMQSRFLNLTYHYNGLDPNAETGTDLLNEMLNLPEPVDYASLHSEIEALGVNFPPGSVVYPYIHPLPSGKLSILVIYMQNTTENQEQFLQAILRGGGAGPENTDLFIGGSGTWDPLWYENLTDAGFGMQEEEHFAFDPKTQRIHIDRRATKVSLGEWGKDPSDPFTTLRPFFAPRLMWILPCAAWIPLLVLTLIPALILTALRKPLARAVRFLPRPAQKK